MDFILVLQGRIIIMVYGGKLTGTQKIFTLHAFAWMVPVVFVTPLIPVSLDTL